MRLLVLGTFWRKEDADVPDERICLNAPSGAGYFLTRSALSTPGLMLLCLNVPCGAGCFRTDEGIAEIDLILEP